MALQLQRYDKLSQRHSTICICQASRWAVELLSWHIFHFLTFTLIQPDIDIFSPTTKEKQVLIPSSAHLEKSWNGIHNNQGTFRKNYNPSKTFQVSIT